MLPNRYNQDPGRVGYLWLNFAAAQLNLFDLSIFSYKSSVVPDLGLVKCQPGTRTPVCAALAVDLFWQVESFFS
jgi:hypothetical protein